MHNLNEESKLDELFDQGVEQPSQNTAQMALAVIALAFLTIPLLRLPTVDAFTFVGIGIGVVALLIAVAVTLFRGAQAKAAHVSLRNAGEVFKAHGVGALLVGLGIAGWLIYSQSGRLSGDDSVEWLMIVPPLFGTFAALSYLAIMSWKETLGALPKSMRYVVVGTWIAAIAVMAALPDYGGVALFVAIDVSALALVALRQQHRRK